MQCKFSSCTVLRMKEGQAWVPSLSSIRKAVGKEVTIEELENHVFCGRHASILRDSGMKMFSYNSSVAELRQRAEDKTAARGFANLYSNFKAAVLTS